MTIEEFHELMEELQKEHDYYVTIEDDDAANVYYEMQLLEANFGRG